MNYEILDDFPLEIDMERFSKRLRIKKEKYHLELEKLVEEAQQIARPKALYQTAYIESNQDGVVVIDGQTFKSELLAGKLKETHRVFAYLATCGLEVHEWAQSFDDMLYQYWADEICQAALSVSWRGLFNYLKDTYAFNKIASMSPGRLENWPLSEQVPLFELFEPGSASIGVELTSSCLMMPVKTISGFCFSTDKNFESCELCPREKCSGRMKRFNRELYESMFAKE